MTKQQPDNEDRLETTLGDLLYKTRKAQHKTLEDAAQITRINPIFLQALEQDDYAKLPAEVFIRGFIKLYAAYLGLDPSDTFTHYMVHKGVNLAKPEATPYPDDIIDTELLDKTSIFKTKKSRKTTPVIILLSILVLFYVLGVFFKSEEQSSLLQPTTDITKPLIDPTPPTEQGEISKTAGPTSPKIAVPETPVKSPLQTKQKVKAEPPIGAEMAAPPAAEEPTPPTPAIAIVQPLKPIEPVTLPITVTVATESNPSPDIDFKYILEVQFEEGSLVRIKALPVTFLP